MKVSRTKIPKCFTAVFRKLVPTLFSLLLISSVSAQAPFAGSYTQNFDGMGTGAAAPAHWSFFGNLGGDNNTWKDANGISAASVGGGTANATLTATTTFGSGTRSNTLGYNFALSTSSTDRALGTSPTSGSGVVLQLSMTNDTGSPLEGVRIAYDIRRFRVGDSGGNPVNNELPGYWLFYSTDNGTTWTNVSALNPVVSGPSGVVVPNTNGVTNVTPSPIYFPVPVAAGGEVRFRWVDDNADESSPDQIIGLDNVVIDLPQPAPSVTLTAPGEGASFNLPATVNLSADASDSNGSIALVEFFAGSTRVGEDSTAPYVVEWTGMLSGAYSLTARATDNEGAVTTSAPIGITVSNPNNQPPTVTLTAPADGANIAGDSTVLAASASDPDGAVVKVEFFNGSTKLGEDTTAPYTYNWTGVATGVYSLSARVIDNDGAAVDSAPASVTFVVPVQTTAINRRPAGQPGSVWKYLDNGSDQGTAWRESAFDDSGWASGAAPLGYGDSHIQTTVNSGPSGNRIITTYLRRTFDVTGAGAVQSLNLNVLRDDGVVVYINGVEVARQNMPEGPINYLTNAASIVDSGSETTYFTSTVTTLPPLNEGANVIAVELHNRDGNSSDLGFDLELVTFSLPGTPPTIELTGPADGTEYTAPATVTITAAAGDSDGVVEKVEFFNGNEKLGEDLSAPFTFDWTVVPQGDYTLTARATDNYGLTTFSDPVEITVGPPNTIFPTVTITSPLEDDVFLDPADIVITAAAADADGSVVKVEFFEGANKLGEDTVAPFTFEWAGVPAGTYTLTARATDNLTAATVSAPVTVAVAENLPPVITLATPLAAAAGLGSGGRVNLTATVSDPEAQDLAVTFYGRLKSPPPGEDFTLVTIPDTQFYSENSGGNRIQLFENQTNWIVNNRQTLKTAFVAHMGDMTQSYNNSEAEFIRADGAMSIIENPLTTLLTHGIPWGGAPGNHDIGSGGNTSLWNQYFGISRWAGRPSFGGGYTNNTTDQNYHFFSGGGMDFIVIHLAYNSSTSGNQAVMDWADALLKAHPDRRGIVVSHWLIGTSFPPAQSSWGGHGQAVYDNLKDNPNLFLMLCGHIHGEGRRADTFEGRTVNTVLQDYQSRANGGDSWLRYFTFKPSENKIYAYTIQTNSGTMETDADSQFTLDYDMASTAEWTALGTVNVPAGETGAILPWAGLEADMEYEWYAAVSDGVTPVGSAPRTFITNGNAAPLITLTAPADASTVTRPATVDFTATASDPDGEIAKVEFYNGVNKVGEDTTSPYTFSWDAPSGVHTVSARAIDGEGASTDSTTATVTVRFDLTPLVTGSPAGGSVSGGAGLTPGSTGTFIATPNAGYTFVGWVVDGNPAGNNSTLEITVAETTTVEAAFAYIPFTLQLLHLSDGEAGLLASQTAPNLAALVDGFDGQYANTLILSGGDNFIPSPFLNAGTDPALNAISSVGKTNFARPDIAIHNLIGVEASGIGNHEWDLGSAVFIDAIRPDAAWGGARFPHLSANLDFSLDSAANGRFTDVPLDGATTSVPEAETLKSRLVPTAVITKGGEKIGLLGVTTQILRSISSPSGTFAKGFPVGTTGVDDMDLLATQIQPYINELIAEGVNKIVLISHLQQIANEQLLATRISGVDIILAAGSNTRLGDVDDVAAAFPGHAATFAGDYPIVTSGIDGKPALIVNTDNEYTYLGRLVIDFDENGEVILSDLPARRPINGAYAATIENVAAAWGVPANQLATTAFAAGTKASAVKEVTDAVQSVINAKDGDVKGYTSVYLEGERNFVRSEETNFGNLSSDANAEFARAILNDGVPVVALKNGGGIRAQIGSIAVGSGEKLPPSANPTVGKLEGGISQLDIENALRFNNRLMVFDTTPQGLKNILEHGVAAGVLQGRFPQIGGISFAWDPTLPAGERVTTISLVGEAGQLQAALYDGTFSPWAPSVIRLVTLNFLAGNTASPDGLASGGDGYPMRANGSNFRFLLDDGTLGPVLDPTLNFTAAPALPANPLGEQQAFADFLGERHGTPATAYEVADTTPVEDRRIQNLSLRGNTVPFDIDLTLGSDGVGSVGNETLETGERQGFRFTLADRRFVSLTGSGAPGLSAELLDLEGNVVGSFNEGGELFVGALLEAGDYLLRVLNPGETAATLSLTVDAGTIPETRPDVAVGSSFGTLRGVGLYGAPASQAITLKSKKLRPVQALAVVANRGTLPDTLNVRGTAGNSFFRTVYLSAGLNVTAGLVSGTFETGEISDGDNAVAITALISPDRKRLVKKRGKRKVILRRAYLSQIDAISTADPIRGDSGQVRVLTK